MPVCDGLAGLPDAVNTVRPATIVQTRVVHLLRNSFRCAARQDWEKIAKALRPVHTAPTEDAALERFVEFTEPSTSPSTAGSPPDAVKHNRPSSTVRYTDLRALRGLGHGGTVSAKIRGTDGSWSPKARSPGVR